MAETKDDYNPYEHRDVAFPISNIGALMNVIKAIIGTGILVAPMAFHNAGWLNALIGTTLIGIIVLYSKQMLMYDLYEVAKRRRVPLFTYADGVVEAVAEGPPCVRGLQGVLRCSVNSLLSIYHFGSCCVYVVFIANCVKDLADHYWTVLDSRIYMCCEILPLCVIYCVPNLKSLVPYAMAANFSLLFGHVLSVCPYYKTLVEIFGQESNVKARKSARLAEPSQIENADSEQSASRIIDDGDSSSQYLSDNPIAITPERRTPIYFPSTPTHSADSRKTFTPKPYVTQFEEYHVQQSDVQTFKIELDSAKPCEELDNENHLQGNELINSHKTESMKEFEMRRYELEKIKIEFEREKFKMEMAMQDKRLKLDEEKLKVEQNWQEKEFKLKKLEIEKNERIAMYEIDKKYQNKCHS